MNSWSYQPYEASREHMPQVQIHAPASTTPSHPTLNPTHLSQSQYFQPRTSLTQLSFANSIVSNELLGMTRDPGSVSLNGAAAETLQYQTEMEELMMSTNPVDTDDLNRRPSRELQTWQVAPSRFGDTDSPPLDYAISAERGEFVLGPYEQGSQWFDYTPHSNENGGRISQSNPIPINNAIRSAFSYAVMPIGSYGGQSDTPGSFGPRTPRENQFQSNDVIIQRDETFHPTHNFMLGSFGGSSMPSSDKSDWLADDCAVKVEEPMSTLAVQTQHVPCSQFSLGAYTPLLTPPILRSNDVLTTPDLDGYSSSLDCGTNFVPTSWPDNQLTSNDKAARDELLIECRRRGMSYKEIKSAHNFTEAESTLRGRHRTLTKEKKDRVRKPEWTRNDVRISKNCFGYQADPGVVPSSSASSKQLRRYEKGKEVPKH